MTFLRWPQMTFLRWPQVTPFYHDFTWLRNVLVFYSICVVFTLCCTIWFVLYWLLVIKATSWRPSEINDDDEWWPKVNNRFLRITFDPKEIETWEWSHCISLIEAHWYICNMTYLGHHVTLTWGQILTLTFQGHAIHVSMRLDEENTMVSKSLLYHFKRGRNHRKTVSLKNAVFDLWWPLTPKPLVLGEIWRHCSERAFQGLSIAFLNFDVSVTGTEIMRIIWSYVM